MFLMKIVLLDWYSDMEIIFRKFEWNLALKMILKIFNFWQLWLKKSYKLSKNPLNVVICLLKSIEFYWTLYKIPQLSSY